MTWEYRRLKAVSQRSSLLWRGTTAISLRVKALDVAGVPADSNLRRPESIYYDSDIRELLSPGSPPPKHPAQVSEVPITDQVPPAPVEIPTDSRQDAGQGKEVEAPQGKDKSKDKGKGKTSDTTIFQPEQAADPGAPKAQV